MMRFRRYRVYLFCAIIVVILFVQISRRNEWSQYVPPESSDFTSPTKDSHNVEPPANAPANTKISSKQPPWTTKPAAASARIESSSTKSIESPPSSSAVEVEGGSSSKTSAAAIEPARPPTIPFMIPDRSPHSNAFAEVDETVDEIHPIAPPGRQEQPILPPAPTTIHWKKQIEHFPVPTESLIHLPTGQPVKIPRIQHVFSDETTDAKLTRENRQTRVRDEFRRAWGGYKKYAWMHDELSPVSGKFRDPFCGWAATLVDALDTLWIMGLQDEFEEAVKAVELIDFTTSPRGDIPVFETTIRYLGGLLAAYDVSGARYKNLLDKAVELADILMGAFDTPNRMPILYYRWKPTFASQPHRASQRSNLAELGSLSMEFTRLAQLTHDTRYYDAIARITNALSEWQDRGTLINGVFPENVDASGCNRSVELITEQPLSGARVVPTKPPEELIGYEPPMLATVKEPKPKKKKNKHPSGPGTLEFQIMPGAEGEPDKAQFIAWNEAEKQKPVKNSAKRDVDGAVGRETAFTPQPATPEIPMPLDIAEARKAAIDPKSSICEPQGLDSTGSDKYSMGGGQDSTYEYFPKEYLLLGGLESKYQKMYMKSIDAVRKWMLYRPMVPDNRDILFTGSITASSSSSLEDLKLSTEAEHLTCFIGGMVGLGAKIFGIEGDLEIAKKLTDGCVWAYESTPTGIMPEGGMLLPCKSAQHCSWNETLYHRELDPMADTRDANVAEYIVNRKAHLAEMERLKAIAEKQAEEDAKNAEETEAQEATLSNSSHLLTNGSDSLRKEKPVSLQKRQTQSSPSKEVLQPISHNFKDDVHTKKEPRAVANSTQPKSFEARNDLSPAQLLYQQKSQLTEEELRNMAKSGRQADIGTSTSEQPAEALIDPSQPPTHKEYVAARIKQESLPPGYTLIRSNKYILRPEAIESVWYMYRITGETSWQDKGWKMFESVINATSSEYGHSAIMDVTVAAPYQIDEMESFWLSETLKYFYLLYSTPETISLDDWVLNTEAHPFKRPS